MRYKAYLHSIDLERRTVGLSIIDVEGTDGVTVDAMRKLLMVMIDQASADLYLELPAQRQGGEGSEP